MIYIFDIDGTITPDRDCKLYPHFIEWLRNDLQPRDRIYLATNQGGVGLRYWMEKDGFGNSEKLPTKEQVIDRVTNIAKKIEFIIGNERRVWPFISFAYQSKTSGLWSPTPHKGYFRELSYQQDNRHYNASWDKKWRKPNSGMLDTIYNSLPYVQYEKRHVLFIGDMETDKQAAENAGIPFCFAKDFFNKEG